MQNSCNICIVQLEETQGSYVSSVILSWYDIYGIMRTLLGAKVKRPFIIQ